MAKRRTALVVIGIAAAVFAALALVYAYLALMPTHFDEAEKAMAPARERVAAMTKPRMNDAPTTKTAAAAKREAPMGSVKPEEGADEKAYGPVHRLCFYEELMSYESAKVRNQAIVDCAPFVDQLAECFEPRSQDYGWVRTGWKSEPARGEAVLPLLTAEEKDKLIHRTKEAIAGNEAKPVKYEFSERERELLHRYLDQLEEFLLREEWDLSAPVQPVEWKELGSYHIKATMAIARESLRGDQRRAVRLIDRYFESIRLMRLFYLQHPLVRNQEVIPSPRTIGLNLSELPEFPNEGWEHIRAGLERLKLNKQQLADLRAARSLAWHKEFARRVNEGQYTAKSNFWHTFGGGALESAMNTVIRPVAMRQIERIAVSQLKPEASNEIGKRYRRPQRLALTLKLMNMGGVKKMQLDAQSMDRINRRLEDSRAPSWQQIEDYRSMNKGETVAIGRFPIAYLGRWEKKVVKGEKRTTRDDGIERGSPAANFIQKNGHHPDTVEEIEALKKEAGAEEVAKHVSWHDAPPMMVTPWLRWDKNIYVLTIPRDTAFMMGMKKWLAEK